jgi:tetratricopeptide (TPR) repeat protein
MARRATYAASDQHGSMPLGLFGEMTMDARHLVVCGLGLAVCLFLTPWSPGKYARVEVEQVPVERLITNLEGAVKKDPMSVQARVNLARVHGMAYALKSDTAEVRKGKEELGPWFGYEPSFLPFSKVEKTDDADRQRAAKAHLAKAVELFKEAVKLAPNNLPARLGYAWTLEQSGAKEEAIKDYRALIEDAWKKEKDLKELGLGGHTIVAEAAGYLIPLLDKEKDKEEITTLNKKAEQLRKLPRPITPVAIPLRDGLRARDIEDASAAVAFDADGSGLRRRWTWVTKDAAWLVYDAKGRGNISSGLQMFGGVTFWLFWETGYDALASLDDNGDGELAGDELKGLAIWHDVNGDGVCDPGEVKPLSEYGITAVSCHFERDPSHPDRVAFSPRGVTFRDGKSRPTFDLILKPRDGK